MPSIDKKIVQEWTALARFAARLNGYDLLSHKPFANHSETYSEILQHLRQQDKLGLQFYQLMLKELPGYKSRR